MGHNRLGQLPKTHKWLGVIALLTSVPYSAPQIAAATADAADSRLQQLGNDRGFGFSFWMLTQIASAAKGDHFAEALGDLGISVRPESSALQLISAVAERVHQELAQRPGSGDFAEIGALALSGALTETVGQEGRSLFNSSVADVQQAFKTYASETRFGILAHRYFSQFFSRTLRAVVDRELPQHVGVGGPSTVAGASEFLNALDLHAGQTAVIARQFAAQWYSKHHWESKGRITRDETQAFVGYAMKKLRDEFQRSKGISVGTRK